MDKFYFVQIQLHGTVTCDFIICMPATHWSIFASVCCIEVYHGMAYVKVGVNMAGQ